MNLIFSVLGDGLSTLFGYKHVGKERITRLFSKNVALVTIFIAKLWKIFDFRQKYHRGTKKYGSRVRLLEAQTALQRERNNAALLAVLQQQQQQLQLQKPAAKQLTPEQVAKRREKRAKLRVKHRERKQQARKAKEKEKEKETKGEAME